MTKSRRPYLIRAIYDWCCDNGHTPHMLVAADYPGVVVPREYVQEGRITLNVSPVAIQNVRSAARAHAARSAAAPDRPGA